MLSKENVYVNGCDYSVFADPTDNTINVELGLNTDMVEEFGYLFQDDFSDNAEWELPKNQYMNMYGVYNPETKDVHIAIVLCKDNDCFVQEMADYPMFSDEKIAVGEVIEDYVQSAMNVSAQELINEYREEEMGF